VILALLFICAYKLKAQNGAKPKAMEDISNVNRLHMDGFSNYAINQHTDISLPTIRKYLNRVRERDFADEQLLAMDY
jgi:hypothetical protein